MPTNYSGDGTSYPVNVPLPNDGEPAAAVFLSPAWQRLADRTAFLKDLLDRERTSEVAITALPATLTVAQQLVYLNVAGGGLLTLPPPATAVGRQFRIRMPNSAATKCARLMPNAGETINGVAGGYPLTIDGASYVAMTPDGIAWIVAALPPAKRETGIQVFYSSLASGPNGSVIEVYGAGFHRLGDITINGFGEGVVGGSHVTHDEGWMTVTVGAGPATLQPQIEELVVVDPEDPDWDGTTFRAGAGYPVAIPFTIT